MHDPAPHPGLIVLNDDPFNAQTAPDRLIADFLTDARYFYVRSHGAVPELTADHPIALRGPGTDTNLTPAGLRERFAERGVCATLQCAGNRRAHFWPVAETSGDPWDVGAIGTAEWTGVPLIDVLEDAGLAPRDEDHVAIDSADTVDVDGDVAPFGVSIPAAKARDRDVLLAWAMNGAPLDPEHGAPLRLIVPGYAGVRSAKWVTAITVQATPSTAPIQARDYKLFPPWVARESADWHTAQTIDAMPVNAAICQPVAGARLAAGVNRLRGYAIAYGRTIARVDVSADGGATWQEAALETSRSTRWSWTRWQCDLTLASGEHELVVRAMDGAGQMQPERPEHLWNFGGYLATMWHRVAVTAR